jgi:hypothetical protein
MNRLVIVVAALALAAGCKKKEEAGGGDKAADKKAAPANADAGPANAAIAASFKGKIEFTSQTFDDHGDKVTAPAPKGWKPGHVVTLEPPDGSGFGFGTQFWVGKTCNGSCESKPAAAWEKSANEMSFANEMAHTPPPKIIKEDKKPGFRELIAEDQHTDGNVNNTSILMAWWKDGADRMYFCNVDLAPESKDLVNAFEQACLHMVVDF